MARCARFLISLLLAAGSLSCSGKPKGLSSGRAETPELVRLDPGTLLALRDSFNAAEHQARILVILSPT